jgi:hypothetical protein
MLKLVEDIRCMPTEGEMVMFHFYRELFAQMKL